MVYVLLLRLFLHCSIVVCHKSFSHPKLKTHWGQGVENFVSTCISCLKDENKQSKTSGLALKELNIFQSRELKVLAVKKQAFIYEFVCLIIYLPIYKQMLFIEILKTVKWEECTLLPQKISILSALRAQHGQAYPLDSPESNISGWELGGEEEYSMPSGGAGTRG